MLIDAAGLRAYIGAILSETEAGGVMEMPVFGSSMAPLLAEGYRKITLVDTRYIAPELLRNFVSFENADVLFLYSALILNQSSALRG